MEEEVLLLNEAVEQAASTVTSWEKPAVSGTPPTVDEPTTNDPIQTLLEKMVTETTKLLVTATQPATAQELANSDGASFSYSSTMATSEGPPELADELFFSVIDYTIFGLLLFLSAVIGVYFGFISKIKQNNTKEYLLGGKTMNKFPVSASLIATHVSGITILGVPSEIYGHGTQYWMFIISAFTVAYMMEKIYLPVFYDLQLTSAFTYLEKRFDKFVRSAASVVYAIQCLIYIPIVIYVPALAFSQVTGINLHVITPVICVICIFYTTVGGLRAVVWTDTLQFVLMIGAILAIITLGLTSVGGFSEVWQAAERGGRLIFFNMDPNPFVRSSFWTVSLGLTTMWIANLGVSQGCVQRFLAVPDLKVAKNSLIIFTAGLIFIKSCSCFTGLLIYAKYETCDPYTIKKIDKVDQILPYYIMDVGAKIPGLPGLFISGIFSAALSTMSSSLNTLAGTIYEDFLRHRLPKATEQTASNIMKVLVVVLGVLVLGLVFVAERMGQVMHMAISLSGVTSGTMLGIFTAGMVSRKFNTKGIISASVVSIVVTGVIMVGAQLNPKAPMLPLRTDGCPESLLANVTILTQEIAVEEVPLIFRLSFMHYALVGVLVFFAVAYMVSVMTGGGEINDERLLAPFMRDNSKMAKELEALKHNINYADIDLALKQLQKATDEKK